MAARLQSKREAIEESMECPGVTDEIIEEILLSYSIDSKGIEKKWMKEVLEQHNLTMADVRRFLAEEKKLIR